MKISLEWLTDFLPGPLDAQRCAEALTNAGLPVESIDVVGNDTVLDVEVTSNRSDCLCHVGVARELAALLDLPFKMPVQSDARVMSDAPIAVSIDAKNLCPHYTAQSVRDVKVGPSPAWMVRRLEAVGVRVINNVVDITNYVMFELGQPLHAFDQQKLAGPRIEVRTARVGEKLTTLDGHERTLTADMLVIADAVRPVALAGVMGGRETEVSDSTRMVLLESARFDPLAVRRAARALTLHSDSSHRFERQFDPTLPARASRRAAQLMCELAGGTISGDLAEAGSDGYSPVIVSLRPAQIERILGIALPRAQIMDALRRLGFEPADRGERIDITAPSHRLDIRIEVDLIEEVARLIGYDQIPMRDEIKIRLMPPAPDARAIEMIRATLIAAGYFEAMTYSFVSDALAPDFIPPEAAGLARAQPQTRKADGQLRPSLLPGLLEAVRHNEANGEPAARLFEIGPVFWYDDAGALREHRKVGFVGGELRQVRGVVESLLSRLNAGRGVSIVPADHPGHAPGASGDVMWGGTVVGAIGSIANNPVLKVGLRHAPGCAELDLATMLDGTELVPQLRELPKFPPAERDLSLIVAESVRFQQIEKTLLDLKLPQLDSLQYLTTYRGKPLEKGTKSISIRLSFRSSDRTLTGEEVEGSIQKAIEAARSRLSATLRA